VIVADASAILEVLLNTPAASEVGRHLFAPGETIHVPHLIDLEILQALRRYTRLAEIGNLRVEQALRIYGDMLLERYAHNAFLSRIWELRHNFTAYDAAYIALAEALDAPLITFDRALISSSRHRARVLVLRRVAH
jgi:predicted nucleic acid-binding protein